MDKQALHQLVKELSSRIAETYKDFRGCYLYGSQVREIGKKNSDVDIVAIFDHIDRLKDLKIRRIVCELMYKYDVYIDFHTYTLNTLAQNPVYYDEVINKGLFYDAA